MRRWKPWVVISLFLGMGWVRTGWCESVLNFPRMAHEPSSYTGFAIANPSEQAAEVIVTAYDERGRPIQGADVRNPSTLTIAARSQISHLDLEFFNITEPTPGWIQATSATDGLIGFFLFGSTQGTFLDGADLPRPHTELLFPLVTQENGSITEVSLVNPNAETAEIKLRLYDTQGRRMAAESLTLAPHSARRAVVPTLFAALSNFSKAGHIRVTSGCPIIGFEWVRNFSAPAVRMKKRPDQIGLNAVPLSESGETTLYFPQLVSGNNFFAWLNLVNLSERPQQVTLAAYRPDGALQAGAGVVNPRTIALPPFGTLRDTAEALFGLPAATVSTGWLKAKADTGALAGSLTYGNSLTASLAAVPGETRGQEASAYPQVTDGSGYFTGLVVTNPGDTPAHVEIFSLREDGSTVGIFRQQLKAQESIAKLLHEMIGEARGQMRGYLFVRADQPVFSTEVIGSNDGRTLVNIPAQAVTQTFTPETGPDVWVDTDLGDDVRWRQRTFSERAGGRQFVNVIVAPATAHLAPRNTGRRTTSEAAQAEGAKAAVNGGFFNVNTLTALGLVKIDGEQTDYNAARRSVFGILESDYGERTITTIPAGAEYPEAYHALGGGPRLIRDGEIYIPYLMESFTASFSNGANPRTGLGIGVDGTIYIVTVDGRNAGGAHGMSLPNFAQLLLDLGSFQAMNLDGGGSTTMWVDEYGVVNHPSDGRERRVPNILAVW